MVNNIGILDPAGKNDNPLTGQPYSDEYKRLAKIWSTYPAYSDAANIIKGISENQVTLITAGTGSGKTVLIPKYALHVLDYKGNVAITLPKKIVTQSAAEFGAKTLDVELGKEVGYQYRGAPSKSKSDSTKLLYATDGTIVQKLINDITLKEFDIIIIDEAHERKVQIDFLLYLLKQTLNVRNDFRLVIMSATINSEIFEEYFKGGSSFNHIDIGGATNFPIKSHFLDKDYPYNDLLKKGFDILLDILSQKLEKGANDIIFFVVSANDGVKLCEGLKDRIDDEKKAKHCKITCNGDLFCVEVYSGMRGDREELARDKEKYKNGTSYVRKIVIATPVAESSLTIDGIKYVIDSGYQLHSSYDTTCRARKLDKSLITQAQAKQRMGRSGRTEPGICYHLYTENTFNKGMKKYPAPDIRINDISSECLQLLAMPNIQNDITLKGIFKDFIEPPSKDYIVTALNILSQHGAITNGELTPLGKFMNDIPVPNIMMASSIVFGLIYKCSYEVMKIMSVIDTAKMNLNDIFHQPKNNGGKNLAGQFIKAKRKFYHKSGDHISILNVFNEFEKTVKKNNDRKLTQKWCYDNFLKYDTLNRAYDYYKKLKIRVHSKNNNIDDIGLTINEEIQKLDPIQRTLCCIIIGFRTQTAVKMTDTSNYRTRYCENMGIKISKSSFFDVKDKHPKNILYTELFISNGRADLNIVSDISENIIHLLK